MLNKIKLSKEKTVAYSMLGAFLLIVLILGIIFHDSIGEKLATSFNAKNTLEVFKGLGNTFLITLISFIMGIALGLLTCLIEGIQGKNTFVLILKNLFKSYVSIFRGTPMVVQLLIIYFIIFSSYTGDPIVIAMVAFGLNSGAYVSEIIRGGINSVPAGQMEAGRSLGMSYSQVMRKIIFPQAIRNCLPSLGNEFIALIKETSIVGFLGAFDLTLAFRKIGNQTFDYTTVYLVMGVTYFIIVLLFTKLLSLLERKLIKHANVK